MLICCAPPGLRPFKIMNEILSFSATHQARLIRERKISSAELIQVHLEQIARVNPDINAVVEVLEPASEAPAGPLCGVPFSIKDSIEVAGARVHAPVRWGGRDARLLPKMPRWWPDCGRPGRFRLRAPISPTCCLRSRATTCCMALRIILTTRRGLRRLERRRGGPDRQLRLAFRTGQRCGGQRAAAGRLLWDRRLSSRPRGDCRARATFLRPAGGSKRSGRSVRWLATWKICAR